MEVTRVGGHETSRVGTVKIDLRKGIVNKGKTNDFLIHEWTVKCLHATSIMSTAVGLAKENRYPHLDLIFVRANNLFDATHMAALAPNPWMINDILTIRVDTHKRTFGLSVNGNAFKNNPLLSEDGLYRFGMGMFNENDSISLINFRYRSH